MPTLGGHGKTGLHRVEELKSLIVAVIMEGPAPAPGAFGRMVRLLSQLGCLIWNPISDLQFQAWCARQEEDPGNLLMKVTLLLVEGRSWRRLRSSHSQEPTPTKSTVVLDSERLVYQRGHFEDAYTFERNPKNWGERGWCGGGLAVQQHFSFANGQAF